VKKIWGPVLTVVPHTTMNRFSGVRPIVSFHADVSVRACTSCRPLLITNKQKGCVHWVVGYCC